MILGRVIGTVWATRKDPRLERHKLLLVRPAYSYAPPHDVDQLVAVDLVHAGVGDDVVVCLGSPARWAAGNVNLPLDAAVMAVVDGVQLQREAFAGARTMSPRGLSGKPLRPPRASLRRVEWT